jgi:hypothetical protein
MKAAVSKAREERTGREEMIRLLGDKRTLFFTGRIAKPARRYSLGLDLAILASSRSRSVLGVHTVRLCSVRSLDFAKMAISYAQISTGFATLAA